MTHIAINYIRNHGRDKAEVLYYIPVFIENLVKYRRF